MYLDHVKRQGHPIEIVQACQRKGIYEPSCQESSCFPIMRPQQLCLNNDATNLGLRLGPLPFKLQKNHTTFYIESQVFQRKWVLPF
jgi:hypothetical protein